MPVTRNCPAGLHHERGAVLHLRAQRDRGVAAVESKRIHLSLPARRRAACRATAATGRTSTSATVHSDLMPQDRHRRRRRDVTGEDAERQIDQPRERQRPHDRLRPIRKQRQRDDHAGQERHERRQQHHRALAADGPQQADVDQRRQRAARGAACRRAWPRTRPPTRTTAAARAATRRDRSAAGPPPRTRTWAPRAVWSAPSASASARAYHSRTDRPAGTARSATAPLRTMARISASAFHGSIAQQRLPQPDVAHDLGKRHRLAAGRRAVERFVDHREHEAEEDLRPEPGQRRGPVLQQHAETGAENGAIGTQPSALTSALVAVVDGDDSASP